MHNIWRGEQERSWSPGVSVCTEHAGLGLCSCSNMKPKEDQVCSYKCIFLRNGDWKTPPEKRFQKQTGDQNSNDWSAILHFFHHNIEHIFPPTLCFDCREPPVVGMTKRTRGTFWFLASRLRLRPGFDFMVSIVPGRPNVVRLSLVTCFILKSNPVLVSGHWPFPPTCHLIVLPVSTCSPMCKYSLSSFVPCRSVCRAPQSFFKVLVSCHGYVCSCCHHPFLSLIGNFVSNFRDLVSESQISSIFIAFAVCLLREW